MTVKRSDYSNEKDKSKMIGKVINKIKLIKNKKSMKSMKLEFNKTFIVNTSLGDLSVMNCVVSVLEHNLVWLWNYLAGIVSI